MSISSNERIKGCVCLHTCLRVTSAYWCFFQLTVSFLNACIYIDAQQPTVNESSKS